MFIRRSRSDLHHAGEPLGERIIVRGRVVDGDGHAVSNSLIEIWQANAAGRYAHAKDNHPAPLDPNFTGTGRTLTDNDGFYSFVTIKPGPIPGAITTMRGVRLTFIFLCLDRPSSRG